jgi:hypothetical protein
MRRTIITLMLAGTMMALTIPAALANSENSKSTAGAGTTECRPGAVGNELIGGWEPTLLQDYIDERTDNFLANGTDGLTHAEIDAIVDAIRQSSEATWAFCDKNLDGTLCVLRTDPSPYYYLLLDNRPFQTG